MRKSYSLWNSPQAVDALIEAFALAGIEGQRGAGLSPGIEALGQIAIAAMPELVAALTIAHQCAIGGDWHELIEATMSEWNE